MKLAASAIVRNELGRYLDPWLEHLREFCDLIVLVDDCSDDGTTDYLRARVNELGIAVMQQPKSTFFVHEGHARQQLVDWTLEYQPTHVLTLDADEFVSDGSRLRAALEAEPDVPVWSLEIEEIWKADRRRLYAREDGGWRTHPINVVWSPPKINDLKMLDRKLSCRRVPQGVLKTQARRLDIALMHFGWFDPETRRARYERYAVHDGGQFHASSHLRSILYSDNRIRFRQRPWPSGAAFQHLLSHPAVA